jgi:branched-chain amino acid transport system substrate-binding protein
MLTIKRTGIFSLAVLCSALTSFSITSQAQTAISGDVIKIGILTDMSGPYADFAGRGSVEAAQMAIDEVGGLVLGKKVELVFADHQNKADIGAGIARAWFDNEGVDVIADFSNSSVGLAVQAIAKDKNRIVLVAAASSAFTGKSCNATTAQWIYNSYTNGHGLAQILTKRGNESWYLLTVDYAFGHAFAADIRKSVETSGGKVVGEVKFPLNTADMSSFLLQAQSSHAKVIAIIAAGNDLMNAVKQSSDFQITKEQKIVTPITFITDVHGMGLSAAQGLQFVTAFYWDRDEQSRAWSKKFFERRKVMPTMVHAGVYSSVRHYLKAVEAAKTDEAAAVMEKMRALPIQDAFAANGRLREDGQMVHDMYLVQVKAEADSKAPWDYYQVIQTIPGTEVFQPISESECPVIKK